MQHHPQSIHFYLDFQASHQSSPIEHPEHLLERSLHFYELAKTISGFLHSMVPEPVTQFEFGYGS